MNNLNNNKMSKFFKSILVPAFASLFLLTFISSNVHAADKKENPPVDIRYVGSVDYKPVFQIDFDNKEGEEVYLTLKDENGTIIYAELVKGKTYSRKIQLESETTELYDMKVTISLRSKKAYRSQVFQINKNTRTVENVEVAKLQ